jgi:hypothetical protein
MPDPPENPEQNQVLEWLREFLEASQGPVGPPPQDLPPGESLSENQSLEAYPQEELDQEAFPGDLNPEFPLEESPQGPSLASQPPPGSPVPPEPQLQEPLPLEQPPAPSGRRLPGRGLPRAASGPGRVPPRTSPELGEEEYEQS